jgi:hypothetical protein
MATQGQDASDVVRKIAAVIKARQKGQALEDAIEATFAPQQQVPPAGASNPMVEQTSPAPAGAPVGGSPQDSGMMQAKPPVDIQSVLSSLTGSGKGSARVVTRG